MMNDWKEVCEAAGFEPRKMSPIDVYELGGRIIHDPVIRILKGPVAQANGGIVEMGTTAELLKKMSDVDRAALRDRVTQ
jgi:hypothetical protein